MSIFSCKMCNFKTNLRHNFDRHLKTNKHRKNLLKLTLKNDATKIFLIDSAELTQNDPLLTHIDPLLTHIDPLLTHIDPFFGSKTIKLEKNDYHCQYCNKTFTCNSHLIRHMKKNCKIKKEQLELIAKEERELMVKENKKDKQIEILQKTVNKLIAKVGNTTINQVNNNVQLKIFGKENLDMITDEVKKEMIKGPFKMMPKLLKMIYFNKDHPENHTMKLVNKNKELMKVHKKKGWEFVDKQDTIEYIIEDKNYEVDNYYDNNTEEFSQFVKRTYKNFRRLFDNRDKDLWKQIKRDVDLLLWNNM
jgi:hypothetical protein